MWNVYCFNIHICYVQQPPHVSVCMYNYVYVLNVRYTTLVLHIDMDDICDRPREKGL